MRPIVRPIFTSQSRRIFIGAGAGLLSAAAVGAGVIGVAAGRKLFRGGPPPVWLQLAPGVGYERRLLAEPRRTVVHVVAVDLRTPNLEIVVTPIDEDSKLPFRARTTRAFLEQHDLLAAINGDYFAPWRCKHPLDYAPRSGESVWTLGPSAHHGQWHFPDRPGYYTRRFDDCTWYFGPDNRISTRASSGPLCSAISGGPALVRSGLPTMLASSKLNPQTAIAVDRESTRLWMVIVDGRQPNYSEGLTDIELTDLLLDLGAWSALRMDGGGSSTLAIRAPRGRARVANSPIHAGIPGWQRPVANHLGIRLRI